MPSAYYNLYDHHIAHDGGAAVVAASRERAGNLAVVRFNDFFSDQRGMREYAPALVDHLVRDWELSYKVGREDFLHLQRREEPSAGPRGRSALPDCDLSRGYQQVREHLLFPALYHDPGTGREMEAATIETSCTVRVPADGLAARDARRLPRAEARGARHDPHRRGPRRRAEAEGPDGAATLRRRGGPGLPAPRRVVDAPLRVDLSRWAGRELRIILRTVRRGQVEIRPLEARGFGTVWEDPRWVAPGDEAAS